MVRTNFGNQCPRCNKTPIGWMEFFCTPCIVKMNAQSARIASINAAAKAALIARNSND